MFFTVTIDTEEDDWGKYDLPSYSLENIARIPRLQQMFDDYDVRPTYLITYPVATDAASIDVLRRLREGGRCEIGTHPHPWNTPPSGATQNVRTSYISNLPPALQYEKIRTLHDAITRSMGAAPETYRSGRWAFNDDVARVLIRLGYKVDSSISPATDWREYDGPDYSRESLDPFVFELERSGDEPGGSLLEVPATIDFVQNRRRLAAAVYWTLLRHARSGRRLVAALGRLGVLNHVSVSPETHTAPQMIRLAQRLVDRGTRVVNMFFHSPSLLANCSPFVRTENDALAFLQRIEAVLRFARSARLRSVTMSQLERTAVGATAVRRLSAAAAA